MTLPMFMDYDALPRGERRVLAASRVALRRRVRSGRELYQALADHRTDWLAAFLDQSCVLAARGLPDGSAALDHVVAVEAFGRDRVWFRCDAALAPLVAGAGAYTGPEDSRVFHGKYAVSYRERRPYTSQQLAFSPSDGYTRLEVDLDEECPSAGDANAWTLHAGRVALNTLGGWVGGDPFGTRTDPYGMYQRLRRRGLQPSFRMFKLRLVPGGPP